MKTVHFFAFYPHNLPKITDFSPWSSMNPGNTKSLHFDRDGWEHCAASPFFRCAIYLLQMHIQSSSNAQSVFFKFQLPHLWDFAPDFMMTCSCFYDDLLLFLWWFIPAFMMRWFNIDWIPMDVALILFLPLIAILSCREYKIFRPRK